MDRSSCTTRGCPSPQIEENNNSQTVSNSWNKLNVHNWLHDAPASINATDIIEIRFKNTRKLFFRNVNSIKLKPGDIVAVEASPGHDIGIVSLTGELVLEQIRKNNNNVNLDELKKIYRKAKQNDIEKWVQAMDLENKTMLRSRQITQDLNLEMKIGDVEYQGDKTKAIFYYIANERVDFRELIKLLAEEFKVRIEMKQIGARQEAGRIGGIGSCGRELCCATWMTNFVSVVTNSARHQELSLNPLKLAGQCSKLKCCLNYELDSYIDAQKDFPDKDIKLETEKGRAYHVKTDVYKGIMWYSFDNESSTGLIPVPIERVEEIINLNKTGVKIEELNDIIEVTEGKTLDYNSVIGQDSLTRFDDKYKSKKRKNKNRRR